MANWKVTACLSSPLAGDAPYLDSLLEYEMSQRLGLASRIVRSAPAPPPGEIHIPCLRGAIGGVNNIPRCSAPILSPARDRVERFAKRLAVEYADVLSPDKRLCVAVGNATYKSYRLPLRLRDCDRVVWFVGGSERRTLLSLLDSVHSIGHKRSQGFGRVSEWTAVEVEHDWSWFAPCEAGTLLMRALPWCDKLPPDLTGFKRWFGACQPPRWHPDRFREIVVPC
jgi:hypothetical protein